MTGCNKFLKLKAFYKKIIFSHGTLQTAHFNCSIPYRFTFLVVLYFIGSITIIQTKFEYRKINISYINAEKNVNLISSERTNLKADDSFCKAVVENNNHLLKSLNIFKNVFNYFFFTFK